MASVQSPHRIRRERLIDASNGGGLSREDAIRLIRATGSELIALMQAASALRDRRTGTPVTYSRKVFIPLTNLCRDTCGYCTFVRRPTDAKAHTMTPDEVLAVARAGKEAGCKEALFSLGDKPELVYPSYRRWLAERGYDTTFGARPMARLIQDQVKRPLADEMLFGRLKDGGKVEIDAGDEALTFEITPARTPPPSRVPEPA